MKAEGTVTGGFIKFVTIILSSIAIAVLLAMTVRLPIALAEGDDPSASAPSALDEQLEKAALGQPIGGLPLMGDDYVWFGRNLELGQCTIVNDLIAAGQTVKLTDCVAGGSIRAAAQDIVISGSKTGENITVAAQDVTIQGCEAKAVAVAGSVVSVSGSCKELTVYAEKVFIDATVEGDVAVGANTVEIGSNARIKGTLHVSASSDPVMQRGAEVGDVEFEQSEGASTADVESSFAALGGMLAIMAAILGIISTLLIAVLAEWLFKRHTAAAAEMIRSRTGATIGTGIIGAIVAPIAIIILICLVITLPVAGALVFALLAMTVVAGGFAGASLFKLAFPRLGRFKCALAGGAIVGVASAIPFLGSLVGVAAFMYMLGYVLQSIFLGTRNPSPAAPVAPGGMAPAAPIAPSGMAPAAPIVPNGMAPTAPAAPAAFDDTTPAVPAASCDDQAPSA